MRTALLLALMLFAGQAVAQGTDNLERILLPITVNGLPGAYDTRWTSVVEMYRDASLVDEYLVPLIDRGCEPASCNEPIHRIPGRVFALGFFSTTPGQTNGSYVWVARASSEDTFFSLRLLEGSNPERGGVEIPVVREREFRDDSFSILDIPPPSTSRRLALRIYGSDPAMLGSVRVRIEEVRGSILSDEVHSLAVDQKLSPKADPLPLRPPTAELYYVEPFSETSGNLRFEIVSLTPGLRLWAFITATDNSTQNVRIYTPQ